MTHANSESMIEPDDMTPAERAVIALLANGRVTAPFASDELDYSLQYVREVLNKFVDHDVARKVHPGLYELVEDPREAPKATNEC